jgi:mannosyltransferase
MRAGGWGITLIVLLAAALRLFRLGTKELWYDEASSLALALNAFAHFGAISYKPVYFLFLKSWIFFTGTGAFWVRLPSVVFGAATVYTVYLLGRDIRGRRVGLISAFLLAVSCFHIYHSQQARHFTLLALLSSISFLYYFRALRPQSALSCRIWNTAANITMAFVHPFVLSALLLQYLYARFAAKDAGGRRHWGFFHAVTGMSVLVWLLLTDRAELLGNTGWIVKPELSLIFETFQTFAYGGQRYGLYDYFLRFDHPWAVYALGALSAVFFLKGARENFRERTALILWTVFPMAIALLISIVKPVFLVKHVLFCLPPFCVLMAIGIASFRRISLLRGGLLAISLLTVYPLSLVYTEDKHIHWRDAAVFLKQHAVPGDAVLISTASDLLPFLYYYGDPAGSALIGYDKTRYCKGPGGECSPLFLEHGSLIGGIPHDRGEGQEAIRGAVTGIVAQVLARKPERIWLLMARWTGAHREAPLAGLFLTEYSPVREERIAGIHLYKFERMGHADKE